MTRLLIYPQNGNALEALDCLGDRFELLGFVDDSPAKQGQIVYGHPVHSRKALDEYPDALVLAVPGSPDTFGSRRRLIEGLDIAAGRFATLIHVSARVSPLASIGSNVLIMAGVVITSNARIGDHVCILPNTVIHHDARIGDWSLIGSGVTIAGGVVIGENCYIGSASSIINGARLGDSSLVGIGSNLIASFPVGVRVAGNPARVIGQSESVREDICR